MSCDHLLDDCGCCEPGTSAVATVDNPPGKPSLDRRVGTASNFARQMLAGLTAQPALDRLTTRRADDPAIALVDAWSVVLDVLTFYSERLGNEGYLRTALDGRSLAELAQSVGYQPGRGRAAATLLAFTLEEGLGAPTSVPIPRGTKVASLPGPGEVPQTYETSEDVEARTEWNAVQARSKAPQELTIGATHAFVEGVRTDIAAGDAVLLVGREREAAGASQSWAFRLLSSVQRLPERAVTRLTWSEPLGSPSPSSGRAGDEKVPDPRDARLHLLRRRAGVFGAAAPDYRLIDASVTGSLTGSASAAGATSTGPKVITDSAAGKAQQITTGPGPDWPYWTVKAPGQPENTVDLDALYPTATPGSWAVLSRVGATACYRIEVAREESRTDYTLNAKVSRLTLQGPFVSSLFSTFVRQTSAFVGSELLLLAGAPVPLPVQGDGVELATSVPPLAAGRSVVVRGPRPVIRVAEGVRTLVLQVAGSALIELHPGDELEVVGPATHNEGGTVTWPTSRGTVTAGPEQVEIVPPDEDNDIVSEVAFVASPTTEEPKVDEIRLAAPLVGCFDRESVRILANVAAATHGETRTQVLGSGDAGTTYQRFTLAQTPLTYTAAASGGAVVSTLEVRVDGQLWSEVPRLFGTGSAAEVYTTSMDDAGVVTVQFGDGLTGARLPTGTNNVTATYRVGTGLSGKVAVDQLTLLMTRPLGVRSVTNPIASGLAADAEPPDAVRGNTPRTALTLDRVVSLTDVEDFARSVPGIGKAAAVSLWDGRHRFVHLTVAGVGEQRVDEQAIADLDAAIRAVGDPRLPLVVQPAEVVPVAVTVSVVVDPVAVSADVLAAVGGLLGTALSIKSRGLGQALTSGDIILAAHAAPGVTAVTVSAPAADASALGARIVAGTPMPAQVVALAGGGLTVTEAAL